MILLEIIENTPGVAKAEEGISKRSLSKALVSREGKVIRMLSCGPLMELSLALSRNP